MKWTVTPFSPNDLPRIAQFFKRHYKGLGSYGSIDLFQWKILDNYLMQGIINLVKDGDRIASTTSVTPKRLFLNGGEIRAAEIGDTYTDAAYQRQGIFTLLVNRSTRDALARGVELVYGTPNQQSLPGYEKNAGYKTFPNLDLMGLSLPINIAPLIQRKVHWLLGAYAGVVAVTLEILVLTVRKLLGPAASTEEITEIPPDWDEFWQSSLGGYDFILARDRRAMEWRYLEHPSKYRLFVSRSTGKIQGYCVYRIIHNEEYSLMVLADFLTRPGSEWALRSLLVHVVSRAVRAGVAAVAAWCPRDNPHYPVLRQFGFLVRGRIPVIAFQNDLARSLAERELRWQFTLSDSDNV